CFSNSCIIQAILAGNEGQVVVRYSLKAFSIMGMTLTIAPRQFITRIDCFNASWNISNG
ncbi:hypothetical protein HN51_050413, partial [Arachis hypogaea]